MRPRFLLGVLLIGSLVAATGSGCGGGLTSPTPVVTSRFSGRVTESAPTQTTPVSGARLQVLASGSRSGATAIADGDGNFALNGVAGTFDVLVQANGYDDVTVHVDSTAGDTRHTIAMMPTLRTVKETVGAHSAPRRPPASFFRDVHHGGSIIVTNLYFYFSFDYTNPLTRTVEVWDGDRLIGAATINKQQYSFPDLTLRVSGGARYEIRITGGEWTAVTIESPN